MEKLSTSQMIDSIKLLSVLELNDLVKAIESEFGVTAAAPTAAVAAEAEASGPVAATVMLTSAGQSKVAVIKAVKTILGLGLMDAKKLVDSAPVAIKENVSADEAEELKSTLEAAGASIELK